MHTHARVGCPRAEKPARDRADADSLRLVSRESTLKGQVDAPAKGARRALYLGVCLIAQATLILEILLTRVTSVIAWYHLAFFVIALAMLGMTAGAVAVFLWPTAFVRERVLQRMAQSALAFSLVAPLAVAWVMSGPLVPVVDFMSFMALLGYGGALALPFALVGVALTLALTRAGLPPGTAYGVDLLGAAGGCLVVIPLLDRLDAGTVVLVAGALASGGALCFAIAERLGGARSRGPKERGVGPLRCALALLVLLGFAAWNGGAAQPWLRPTWVKGVHENPAVFEHVSWNTHSRVTVSKTFAGPPALWAAGRTMPPELRMQPVTQRLILIDGAAGTAMAQLGDGPDPLAEHAYLGWDITAFAHRMRPEGAAAVIGVGGGRDVIEAARVGHAPVVGVELNRDIVALHTGSMKEFSGLTRLPEVELVADEARSFMTRDDRRYQVITMSLIDTWASTGAGAYSLSENGLYTREAWVTFMRRLDPSGIFTVSRWYKSDSPGETARMLALAMESLWELGAARPRDHLILLQHGSVATLLISPSAFTEADVDLMQREAVKMGVNMLVTPRKPARQLYLKELSQIESRAALWRYTSSQELDLTPPTDARPFFFNMLKPRTWLTDDHAIDQLDLAFLGNLRATQTLVYATLVSLALTMGALLGPLWARRRRLRGYPRGELLAACAYFALIGLGFMFVEIGLLSRLNVYIGHPTLALASVLGGIILFAGIGSLLSGRVPIERPRWGLWYPLIPASLAAAAFALQEPVMAATAGADSGVRVLVGLALLGPPALGMGLGFPLGLRLVGLRGGDARPDIGPWLWGINGAFGVCASGLALGTSMVWGVPATLGVGVGCYALLLLCTRALVIRSR